MKILIIYPTPTHPVNAGNKQWVLSQVEILKELGNDVYMLCLNVRGLRENVNANVESIRQTKEFWGDHLYLFNANYTFRAWSTLCMTYRKRFQKGYYHCDDLYPSGLSQFVEKINKKEKFDALIVNYYWLSKALCDIDIPLKAINTHDVFSIRDLMTHSDRAWMCTSPNEEAKALQRARHIFSLQDEESIFFHHLSPQSNIYTVYCPYKIVKTEVVGNKNVVMLASSNILNIKGFEWFVKNIFPLINKEIPECNLVIGGYLCNVLKDFENHPNIKLIGSVEDPIELYNYGDVAINPCTDGTGLKIKTFEALSYGKIAMTHPHSVNGIYDKKNSPVFYSEKPEEWVDFLKKIWGDKSELENIKRESIKYIVRMNEHITIEYRRFLQENN